MVLYWYQGHSLTPAADFNRQVVFLTGISDLLVMIPAMYCFRQDQALYGSRYRSGNLGGSGRRRGRWALSVPDVILLLLVGAGLALYTNVLLSYLQMMHWLPGTDPLAAYMEGYSFPMLILMLGICGPVAEEMVFRWLVYYRLRDYLGKRPAILLSAAIFGIYHLNILQGIYAFILGIVFALFQEWSGNLWTSILLHVGANCFSLALSVYGETFFTLENTYVILFLYFLLMLAMVTGFSVFRKRSRGME